MTAPSSMHAEEKETREGSAAPEAAVRASSSWAEGVLVLTAGIAVVAKVFGVVLAPGVRGVVSAVAVDRIQLASATLGYVLVALLVALVGTASFELARAHRVPAPSRFAVVGLSGLVVALASPAVAERLPGKAALALALMTSVVAVIGGTTALRQAFSRAAGAVLALLAVASLLRGAAWQVALVAGEQSSIGFFHVAQGLATAAVVVHACALLVAGAWLGTRSGWRGRVLANVAIVLAFVITYLAGRGAPDPSTVEAVLRSGLGDAAGVPAPFALTPIAVFLVPAGLFLAAAALFVRTRPRTLLAVTALGLVGHGMFDVPLHALAALAAAEWAMLARDDAGSAWRSLTRRGG